MPTRPKPLPATVVLLVRHGLTPTTGKEMPASGAGPNLSEEGWKQAGQAAEHISAWRATLPALAAFYPAFIQRPEALRWADVRTIPQFNEFSVWEMQAPEAELFAVLLGLPTLPTAAVLAGN